VRETAALVTPQPITKEIVMKQHLSPATHVMFALAVLLAAAPAAAQKTFTQAKAQNGGVTAGDAPGFPVTISVSGSYLLAGNLTVSDANTHAIHITADHVTLDLGGFRIDGPSAPGAGVAIFSEGSNITIVNGTVAEFGSGGIFLLGNSHRVENVRALLNGGRGIFAGANSAISRCIATFNGHTGITIGSGTVSGNTSESNGVYGISASDATVTNNSVRQNGSHGLWLGPASGYAYNVLSENNRGGAQVTGGVQMGLGTNICNGAPCS
jgi:hypothetical protein